MNNLALLKSLGDLRCSGRVGSSSFTSVRNPLTNCITYSYNVLSNGDNRTDSLVFIGTHSIGNYQSEKISLTRASSIQGYGYLCLGKGENISLTRASSIQGYGYLCLGKGENISLTRASSIQTNCITYSYNVLSNGDNRTDSLVFIGTHSIGNYQSDK
jgi:hypothetical protein